MPESPGYFPGGAVLRDDRARLGGMVLPRSMGRWLAVAVGAALSTPYLAWAGVAAVLLTVMDRFVGMRPAGR